MWVNHTQCAQLTIKFYRIFDTANADDVAFSYRKFIIGAGWNLDTTTTTISTAADLNTNGSWYHFLGVQSPGC